VQEERLNPRYRLQPGSFAYYALGYAAIRDISLGGVFIEDRVHEFTPGNPIDLELRLNSDVVSLRGVVRRAEPNTGFSVQFLDVPNGVKQRLESHFRNPLDH